MIRKTKTSSSRDQQHQNKYESTEDELTALRSENKKLRSQSKRLEELADDLARDCYKKKLQLRAAIETNIATRQLDPNELWIATTALKSANRPTSTFVELASRWAAGLPIDSESLREAGLYSNNKKSPLHENKLAKESKIRKLAKDSAQREIAGYLIPLLDSIHTGAGRIEDEITKSLSQPNGPPHPLASKLERLSSAIAHTRELLYNELLEDDEDTQ